MSNRRLATIVVLSVCLTVVFVAQGMAQLPPEAVLLDKVKIPETIKADDPFEWAYDDVTYDGAKPPSGFKGDAAEYAVAAKKERYVQNFMLAMSTIWCPITDEVTPGGRLKVEGLGYQWESCCSFCDEEMHPENFREALVQLRKRAETSWQLTSGKYTPMCSDEVTENCAKSPVEGAIDENI